MKHFRKDQVASPRADLREQNQLRQPHQRWRRDDRGIMWILIAALAAFSGVIWLLVGWLLP
ncbi:hypothetical protein [Paracoccus sp. PAR01]|uniref:hypothetical protein n=1 Tax=Paracoccus sp. PAR01 TaxID=2769282 RepID=UPI00178448DE|nr:hypothetical protein [Paracoccus sp. PAR01]MBD9529873.1 hypothetical protein [Paracoccus sp. PAR01]